MNKKIKLVVFDLDETLTVGPTIWELVHKINGSWQSRGLPYWRSFCRKIFGYDAFIRKDVACWRGLPLARVRRAIRQIRYVPDLRKTIQALKRRKIKTAIVSSSLEIFARHVSKKFGLDHVLANPIGIKNGKLTGQVRLKVPGRGKGRCAKRLRKKLGLKRSEVLAVGDSRYDLPLFKQAGLCVTFTDARPAVKKAANLVISKKNLSRLLRLV